MLAKVRILEQVKEKFVEKENFENAKQLKEQIDRVKNIGIQLTQLDERMRMASVNEDYDSAKILKAEKDRLKAVAFSPWVQELIRNF